MLEIILAILASYRVAHMVALEDGPFDVFSRMRIRIDLEEKTWIGRGLNCPLCVGVWTSLVVALLVPFATWQALALDWLGIAGGMAVLHRMVEQWES